MAGSENKIQLVVEAYNMSKATLDALGKQIKAIGDETAKTGQQSKSMLGGIKENWLAISAAVAGTAVAINQALDLMSQNAKAQQAEATFRNVAAAAGESADKIIAEMKRASNGTVDDSDIMQKAVKGMMQGLSGNQLVKIMETARLAARVAGEDVGQAYETITDAIANQMPRALLRYGLVTKTQMKEMNEAIAKGATELDLYRVVMYNFEAQSEKAGKVMEDNREKLQQLHAWWTNLKETIGGTIWSILTGIKNLARGSVNVVMGILSGGITGIMGLFMLAQKGLNRIGLVSDETLAKTTADFEKLKQMSKDFFSSAFGGGPEAPEPQGAAGKKGKRKLNLAAPEMLGPDRSNLKAWQESQEIAMKAAAAWKAAKEGAINYELSLVDIAEASRGISKAEATEKRIALNKQMLGIQEEYLTKIDKLADPAGWYAQQEAIAKTRGELLKLNKVMQEQTGTLTEGIQEGFAQYLYELKTAFQNGVKFSQEAAQAMEQAFSDFFFDAMNGKMKHFSDYIKSFLQSIARAIANIMAQQAAAGVISSINWGGSGSTGGTVSFHSGGYVPRFHVGGLSSDERPAILQTGEYVVSRRGVAALDRINQGSVGGAPQVTVQVINQSSQPVDAKQTGVQFDGKAYVVGVVLSDLEYGGPIRSAVAGVKK